MSFQIVLREAAQVGYMQSNDWYTISPSLCTSLCPCLYPLHWHCTHGLSPRPARQPKRYSHRHTGHETEDWVVVINYSYLIAFTVTVKPRSYRSNYTSRCVGEYSVSFVCGFKWSNISSCVHVHIFINSSLCIRRRIMYHYGGSTGPGRPPAYAVSDGEVCRRERVHFNSSNSNETAKPDRKPMCWGQVS